jgi:ligand-binding SRPBCC domain-containing protein
MPTIDVSTHIKAPRIICFQLALSVDLHTISTHQTGESIVGGVRTGILKLGDSVTFRARHFGVWQTLTSKVTEFAAPAYFCDKMQQGAFSWMRHEHHFEQEGEITVMRDVFAFASPLGWLGKLADALVLKAYLRRFLEQRAAVVRQYAESGAWQEVLSGAEMV